MLPLIHTTKQDNLISPHYDTFGNFLSPFELELLLSKFKRGDFPSGRSTPPPFEPRAGRVSACSVLDAKINPKESVILVFFVILNS